MAITASDVKALRDATGAGMMDCKKALSQANGDRAQAEKILKEMGLAAVAKRQDRATDNGRVFAKVGGNKAVILELSCETDFVASNEQFKELGDHICDVALAKGYGEVNEELTELVNGLIATIKENMAIKAIKLVTIPAKGYATSYIHGEGSWADIVVFNSDNADVFKNESVREFAHDCALHIAAYKPQFLSPEDVDKAFEDEQLGIFQAQVATMNKPEKVLAGIVRGKLGKLYSEICLTKQPFIKDDTKTVEQKLSEISKAVGSKIDLVEYDLFHAGA